MTAVQDSPVQTDAAEAVVERVFTEGLGAMHLATIYLGIRRGLFAALSGRALLTSQGLAAATACDERYVREWLQAETIAGLVVADDDDLTTARFRLADGVHEVLVDELNPNYLGGLPLALCAIGQALPDLVDAYRTGAGVPMPAYGPEIVAAQAAFNRPAFTNDLAASWLPSVPDVHARLSDATRPARVADIGCGVGWAAIELAKAFPHVRVDGYDADELSLEQARRNAEDHGVSDRVRFELVDVSTSSYGDASYDLVLFLECVHDLGRPVEALAAARAAMADGGAVIVMDERTADTPQVGDPTEMFFATVSAVWCLPQSRTVEDCEAPGTVMRPATFEAFARRAGWAGYEVLPIEHPFFRFYRLVPPTR